MLLNYRDRNWSFRFRLLELICCTALIIPGILLLIFKTELKLYIVVPVLVFASAFTLICLHSIFGFGMQQSLSALRSWIAFATAGMTLFFMTAGFLLVPTKFGYLSHLLHSTIALAFLTGLIFLLDILFMITHLHKLIFPEAPKDTTQIHHDIQSRNVEVQTGPPITVCSVCKQPCQKSEECTTEPTEEVTKNYICDYCRQRRLEGIECISMCHAQPEVDAKSTQMSLEPSIESSQFIEKEVNIQPKPVQSYVSTYSTKPIKKDSVCSVEECRARYNSIADYTCVKDCKKHYIQAAKSVQVKQDSQPKILKIPCDPKICKMNVLQVNRSVQVTPNATLSKSSTETSRIPLRVKKEESVETIKSQKKENYIKRIRSPKVAPISSDVPKIRTEQTNIQKRAKGKVYESKVSANEGAREEFVQQIPSGSVYSNKSSHISPKPFSGEINQAMKESYNATIESESTVTGNKNEDTLEKEPLTIPESNVYKTKATVFTETPEVKTSDKNLQTSNKDPDRFGLKRSHTSMEIPEKKTKIPQLLQTSHSIQTSSSLLKQEKVPTLDKTTSCKSYEPQVIEAEPIIIVLKDYQAPSSPNRNEFVQICPAQYDQVKSIYPVKESPKDVSMQVADYFEKKTTVTPDLNESAILTPMEQDIVFSIHNKQKNRNVQIYNTVYCGCNDKTPSDDGICYKCYKKIQEEVELPIQVNTVPPLSSRDSLLAQQPYAYSPKRNGLDENNLCSPNFKCYEPITTQTSFQDVKEPPQSARVEPVQRDGLSAHGKKKRQTSLPSANSKKDTKLRKVMSDTPEK